MGNSSVFKHVLLFVFCFSLTACKLGKLSIRGVGNALGVVSCDGIPFQAGDGLTLATAYEVCSREQFDRVGLPAYNTKFFKITADIDYGPGGVAAAMPGFSGDLNGNGFTIKNFVSGYPGGGSPSGGLFTTASGTIYDLNLDQFTVSSKFPNYGAISGTFTGTATNITITNSTITSDRGFKEIGGLFGIANGATLTNITATNITVASDGHDTTGSACPAIAGAGCLGGIAGVINNGTMNNCNVNGTSTVSGLYPGATAYIAGAVGGLVGSAVNSNILNSSSTATIYGDTLLGGIAGAAQATVAGKRIQNCHATGNVNYYYNSSGIGYNPIDYDGGGDEIGLAGGLVGWSKSMIHNTDYATGNVKPVLQTFLTSLGSTLPTPEVAKAAAGLIGTVNNNAALLNGGTVVSCYATGDVEGDYESAALVGKLKNGEITLSYSTGTVEGTYNVGGLVGNMFNSVVSKSYSTSNVIASSFSIGGLIGYMNGGTGTVSDVYAKGDVTGDYQVGGLIGYIDATVAGSASRGYAFPNTLSSNFAGTTHGVVGDIASIGFVFSGFFFNDSLPMIQQDPGYIADAHAVSWTTGAMGIMNLQGIGFVFTTSGGPWDSNLTDLPFLDGMP